MAGPWEKYASTPTSGPWEKYGAAPPATPEAKPRGQVFWETIGGQALQDILGGASRDPARAQKALDTFKGLVTGIAHEPARVLDSLARSGEAMTKGDVGAAAYHLAGAVPFLGPTAQQVSHDVEKGNYGDAVERTAGMAAPFVAGKVPGAVADAGEALAASKVGQAARVVGTGIKAAAPEVAAGTAVAGVGELAGHIVPGAEWATRLAGGQLMRSGVTKGLKAAREAAGPQPVGPAPASFTEPPVMAWDAGAPEGAPAAAAAAETPGMVLARESGAKWADLSAGDQAMLESVARARANAAAQPAPRAPMGPPEATTPVAEPSTPVDPRTAAEMMRDEIMANSRETAPEAGPPIGAHKANPPVNGRGAPLTPPLKPTVSPEPTVGAEPTVPVRTLPQVEAGMAQTKPAPIDPAEAQSAYTAAGDKKSPQLIAAERTAFNTAAKADRWAPVLHKFGVTAGDLPNITPPQWEAVLGAMKQQGLLDAGENVPKSSLPAIAERLKALEKGAPQDAGVKAEVVPPTTAPDLSTVPDWQKMPFEALRALFPKGTPKAEITHAIELAMAKSMEGAAK